MSGFIGQSATGGQPEAFLPGPKESAWVAWVQFAGAMLILVGAFHVLQGFVALFRDQVYVVGPGRLVVDVDYTVWGWVHLLGGIVAIIAGVALNRGRMWARVLAVVVAFVSAIVNMAFLPAYPVWSAIMIAVDIVVIWAVVVHGSELKDVEMPA